MKLVHLNQNFSKQWDKNFEFGKTFLIALSGLEPGMSQFTYTFEPNIKLEILSQNSLTKVEN